MRVLGFFSLLAATLFFAHSLIAGALPLFYAVPISERLSLDETAFARLVLIFPAVYIPAQFVAGFLLDRYGARPTITAAAIFAGLGLVLSVLFEVPAVGAAGRALHALGAAFAFVGALFIAARTFGAARFGLFAGLVQAACFVAVAAWFLYGVEQAGVIPFPSHYYYAAALVIVIAIFLVPFNAAPAVLEGGDRPGFLRQILGEIGSVLVRPRLWLIVVGAALAGVPVGLHVPLWVGGEAEFPAALAQLDPAEAAALFAVAFALGSLIAGSVAVGIGRRRGVLTGLLVAAAAGFFVLSFIPAEKVLFVGALLAAGGFFSGASILFYALAVDRAPPHHVGLFIGLVHAGFIVGAAGSVYATALVQPMVPFVDLILFLTPLCLAAAAFVGLIVPDKGPMDLPGPVTDWQKGASVAAAEQAVPQPESETATATAQPPKESDTPAPETKGTERAPEKDVTGDRAAGPATPQVPQKDTGIAAPAAGASRPAADKVEEDTSRSTETEKVPDKPIPPEAEKADRGKGPSDSVEGGVDAAQKDREKASPPAGPETDGASAGPGSSAAAPSGQEKPSTADAGDEPDKPGAGTDPEKPTDTTSSSTAAEDRPKPEGKEGASPSSDQKGGENAQSSDTDTDKASTGPKASERAADLEKT
ncbi:MAG: MFS transporter [Pseudomonadota bacterium]